MLDLAFSVLSSTWIFVVFKLYDVHKVQTLVAIIINYLIACTVGLLLYDGNISIGQLATSSWIYGPVILGVLFITIFNLMAKTAQISGVSVASVATKMSLVIPVILGMALYGEQLSLWQGAGIILALFAVYLASIKQKNIAFHRKDLILPLMVFLGSGAIDASIKYFEEKHLTDQEIPIFSSMVFGCAALSGLLFIAFKGKNKDFRLNVKNILGGVALGIPNYFSIYFLIRALRSETLSSAAVFTLNNVAIVMLSTLLGILLFKERLTLKNWTGILLSILSIIMVALL